MKKPASSYALQHALGVALAVSIAILVNHYFSYSHEGWIYLSAFIVSQTTRGTPLRQGLIYFLVMSLAILMHGLLFTYIHSEFNLLMLVGIIFVVCACIAFINRPQADISFVIKVLLTFAIVLVIASIAPRQTDTFIRNRMIDIGIGTLLTIICRQIIFPVRLAAEFRLSMITILNLLIEHSQLLTQRVLEHAEISLDQKQRLMINYPEWVYEVGFNPGLRSGFRFFLIHVERMSDIFSSMDYIATQHLSKALLADMRSFITISMQKNEELLRILIDYLQTNVLGNVQGDFKQDIDALENELRRLVPANMELLDISPDYVRATDFVYDIKDLRKLLLQLVMALPAART